MNSHEKVALEQINLAYAWVIGSYEDDIKDGIVEKMPTKRVIANEIYEQVMNWTHTEMGLHSEPVHQARFAGKDFIVSEIGKLVGIK